jgi:hypothetical protein
MRRWLEKPGNREKARDAQRQNMEKWLAKPENLERYREQTREGTRRWLEKPGNRERQREASRLYYHRKKAERQAAGNAGPSSGDPTSC